MTHIPVLLNESIEGLNIKPDGVYLDGTLGRGGHSLEIAERLGAGKLIAIDCDDAALRDAAENLSEYIDKITLKKGNFREIAKILDEIGCAAVDGMLFDLGVSSPQLDDASRGFSYMQDARLDMRMDRENPLTAFDIVNTWSSSELERIFFEYGEERYSRQIAKAIVERRSGAPIVSTFELNDIIASKMPAAARREKQHPSKRVFQALRIATGDELGALEEMLCAAPQLLKHGGRICVISFHSLEDRTVKKSFAAYSKGCDCPSQFPVCVCNKKPALKIITRRPITASEQDIAENPRARSAKLRIAEKL